jgi:hypothetical protein
VFSSFSLASLDTGQEFNLYSPNTHIPSVTFIMIQCGIRKYKHKESQYKLMLKLNTDDVYQVEIGEHIFHRMRISLQNSYHTNNVLLK